MYKKGGTLKVGNVVELLINQFDTHMNALATLQNESSVFAPLSGDYLLFNSYVSGALSMRQVAPIVKKKCISYLQSMREVCKQMGVNPDVLSDLESNVRRISESDDDIFIDALEKSKPRLVQIIAKIEQTRFQ